MGEFDTKRNGIPVKVLETGEEFNSIKACADAIGGNASCVSRVLVKVLNLRRSHISLARLRRKPQPVLG